MSGCYPNECHCYCHNVDWIVNHCSLCSSKNKEDVININAVIYKEFEERIKKLENHQKKADSILDNIFALVIRIQELEKWKEVVIEKNIQDNNRIRKLEDKSALQTNLVNIISDLHRIDERIVELEKHKDENQIPFKCPVCNGSGRIIHELLSGEVLKNKCHACQGKGIIWSE
jgi:uncharacterized coiled-coil protein SlyX